MFNVFRKEIEWGGQTLTLETGKVARQADGCVIATYGETVVMATVVGAKKSNPDVDFFPLSVHYQEKAFAAGRIPGGFFKREGRPSENEVLVSRLIDRPIRPLFVDGFKNEVQVVCTVLSHDMENNPDIVAMIAASAALTISGLPFMGPIAGARVGYINNEFVLNPTISQMSETELDLVVAGTSEGVLMVESEANELAEDTMLQAVTFGHEAAQAVINAIIDLAEMCAKDPWDVAEPTFDADALVAEIMEKHGAALTDAYAEPIKQVRQEKLAAYKEAVLADYAEHETLSEKNIAEAIKETEKHHVRGNILKTGSRIDGRDTKTIRSITAEVGNLPLAHGSAVFTRGETQALVVATLGTKMDEQIIDSLTGEYRENFMLHYNFPPYSVGECGRLGSPGRREIGHGKLAWRAIHPLMPAKDEFGYTTRVVSEITESNGSSSMATVCGTSLALMDAGVPLARPVAGIAMGLIKEGDDFAVLSDILGDEDHLGDMDFKVAGSENGVTALQMDIKITSITKEIMEIALKQAKEGRMHILGEMAKAITTSRDSVSDNAPQMHKMKVNRDKIREVIGPGGKTIREIQETTNTKINLEDDGSVEISGMSVEAINEAVMRVKAIAADPEVGEIYDGKVVKVVDFGAFVNFLGARDGLVHVSEMKQERVKHPSDVVKEGQIVKVRVMGFDDRGKIKLSMKVVDQETGEDLTKKKEEATEEKAAS